VYSLEVSEPPTWLTRLPKNERDISSSSGQPATGPAREMAPGSKSAVNMPYIGPTPVVISELGALAMTEAAP